jgi:hypothetical protein
MNTYIFRSIEEFFCPLTVPKCIAKSRGNWEMGAYIDLPAKNREF